MLRISQIQQNIFSNRRTSISREIFGKSAIVLPAPKTAAAISISPYGAAPIFTLVTSIPATPSPHAITNWITYKVNAARPTVQKGISTALHFLSTRKTSPTIMKDSPVPIRSSNIEPPCGIARKSICHNTGCVL